MAEPEKSIRLYLMPNGESPFEVWFDRLRDRQGKARILTRIARVRLGNLGDWKSVGQGVSELRIDYGPGYRLYLGNENEELVILLIGGDKGSQRRDIERSEEYWDDYQKRKKAKKL